MNPSEIRYWKQASADLGIEIVTPFELTFPDGVRLTANALVRNFGAPLGMVVDDDWVVLEPHADTLIECGYGFSCVEIGPSDNYKRESFLEMLADWNWSGNPSQKPSWLPTIGGNSSEDA